MKSKETLRKEMRRRLKLQKKSERRKKSQFIQKILFNEKAFLTSRLIMLYSSKGTNEVETGSIIKKALEMGKKVVLPVTSIREKRLKPVCFKNLRQGLKKSLYGIYEPRQSGPGKFIKAKDIDLVIVPGLAFDKDNERLGRGKGYYDGFLRTLPLATPKIGLGFRFQLFKKIPATEYDVSLTKVITD